MASAFNVLLRSDRDEVLARPGEVVELDGDLEQAWLPVRCRNCGETVLAVGEQRGRADRDMTATAHAAECENCGNEVRAELEWLQERFTEWQPLANADVEGGEAIEVGDLAESVE